MQMIGNNIRERRVRLRRSFARAVNKNSVPVVGGVSVDSWNAIYESLSNPGYQAKSDKCKVAADERTRRKGFTHKLGPRGVNGLVTIFMDEFGRQPTEEEVHFAKQNGIQSAVEEVRHGRARIQMEEAVKVTKPAKTTGKTMKKRKGSSEDEESAEEAGESSSGEDRTTLPATARREKVGPEKVARRGAATTVQERSLDRSRKTTTEMRETTKQTGMKSMKTMTSRAGRRQRR